jgi:hypothetical protein
MSEPSEVIVRLGAPRQGACSLAALGTAPGGPNGPDRSEEAA